MLLLKGKVTHKEVTWPRNSDVMREHTVLHFFFFYVSENVIFFMPSCSKTFVNALLILRSDMLNIYS